MHLYSSLEEPLPSLFRALKLEALAKHVAAARLLVEVLQDLVYQDTALDILAILVLVIQEDLLRLVWLSHILKFTALHHLLLQFAAILLHAAHPQPPQSLLRFQPLEMAVAVTANHPHLSQPTLLAALADHMEEALIMTAMTLLEKWNAWIKTSATFRIKLKIAVLATVTTAHAAIDTDHTFSWKKTVPTIFRRVYNNVVPLRHRFPNYTNLQNTLA